VVPERHADEDTAAPADRSRSDDSRAFVVIVVELRIVEQRGAPRPAGIAIGIQ
jgi:hypothetical protein